MRADGAKHQVAGGTSQSALKWNRLAPAITSLVLLCALGCAADNDRDFKRVVGVPGRVNLLGVPGPAPVDTVVRTLLSTFLQTDSRSMQIGEDSGYVDASIWRVDVAVFRDPPMRDRRGRWQRTADVAVTATVEQTIRDSAAYERHLGPVAAWVAFELITKDGVVVRHEKHLLEFSNGGAQTTVSARFDDLSEDEVRQVRAAQAYWLYE